MATTLSRKTTGSCPAKADGQRGKQRAAAMEQLIVKSGTIDEGRRIQISP
jgi:hypothetical protein